MRCLIYVERFLSIRKKSSLLYHNHLGNHIIDNDLKSSIFVEIDVLWITGRNCLKNSLPIHAERWRFAQLLKFCFYIDYFPDHSEINFAILFDGYFRVFVIH